MREFEQKRKVNKMVYSYFSVIILLLVVYFLVRGVYGIYQKSIESNRQVSIVKNKLNELIVKEEKIQERIDYLNSPLGQEEEVRNRFLMAKEGEHVIIIIDKEDVDIEKTSLLSDSGLNLEEKKDGELLSNNSEKKQTFWQKFISLISF